MSLPQVLVLGGGYGGVATARALDAYAEVTLVERNSHFFHAPGALRVAVDVHWLPRILIPYDQLLKRGRVLQAAVAEVGPQDVLLEDGQRLRFDYLVLALGSRYPFPARLPATEQQHASVLYKRLNARIAAAKHILLLGAGPVGIELAGEIISTYPGCRVTLLDPAATLLSRMHPCLGARLSRELSARGVQLLLGERAVATQRVDADGVPLLVPQLIATERGLTLEADLVLATHGMRRNSETLRPALADALDQQGAVRVNDALQLISHPTIFAVGDLTDLPEGKLASTAGFHSQVVAANIRRLAAGRSDLKRYTPLNPGVLVVPIGSAGGAAQLPLGRRGLVLGAWAASRMKGRSLLVERYWKLMGAAALAPSNI